ncbi:MAG: outer membrane lipoprotein carrier protein LolA [Desulfocapsaceae bacterium]|nr:outer membrane lipoprotein carrier protein LolA [Desulfocapsaceae bacterium]
MKQAFLIPIICLLLVIPSWPVGAAEQQIAIQTIQAEFTQEKHLKILKKPLISTGIFVFAAPQSLRWEYHSPIPSILLMHDGSIQKYTEQDGKFVADRGMRLDAMQVVLTEISNWLDGRFRENDIFTVTFPDQHTVLLLPKDAMMANLINKIELKLADQQGLLDSVTIFEGPEAYTHMSFSERILNKNIPASVFNSP